MTAVPFDSLTVKFEVSWSTDPFDTPSYTDESAYVRSWSTRRGRSSTFDQFSAGTLTVEVDNSTRRFDPLYASSPLYPNVLPRKKCRLTVTYSAVDYVIFTGFLDSVDQMGEVSNTLGLARLNASDGFKMLARIQTPTGGAFVGDGDTIDERIERVLDYAAWPAGDRDISGGDSTLVHMIEDGGYALSELYEATNSDLGQFFIAADGKATYRGHLWQLENNLTASAVIGEDVSSGEIPYTDPVYTYSDADIFNRVILNHYTGDETAGYVSHTVDESDTASVTAYGESTKSLGTVATNNENVALNTAEWILFHFKDARLRCRQVTFNPRSDPASQYPVLLAADIGTRWTFKRRPQNVGSAIEQDVIVEGVSHTMTAETFRSTFDLSQAPGDYWRIGVSKLGASGTAIWA